MTNWRRILLGGAFVHHRDPNYYRDVALLWPFLLFSVISVSDFFLKTASHMRLAVMFSIAAICLIAAKEKLILLSVSLSFVALRCLWAFITVAHDLRLMALIVVTALLSGLILFFLRNKRLSYEWPEKSGTIDLIVGVASLAATIALLIWLDRHFV